MSRALDVRLLASLPFAGGLLAFALLGVAGVASYTMVDSQVENAHWVEHTNDVLEAVARLSGLLSDSRRTERGYLLAISPPGAPANAEAIRKTRDVVRRLRVLTRDNPSQQARLDRLEPAVEALIAHIEQRYTVRGRQQVEPSDVISAIREGDDDMAGIAPLLTELYAEERRLLVVREEAMTGGTARSRAIQLGSTAMSIALLGFAFFELYREHLRRHQSELALRRSEAATQQLNDDLERRVQVRTAELATANRELEAFSYSVAHDLRTPLRGLCSFSEILLQEHAARLDAEGVDALHEICDGARKMGDLIDALLSLSRVTRCELKFENVDLTAKVKAIVAGLQAHESSGARSVIIAEDVHALLDPELATTLLENLLHNAWKFTSKVPAPRIEFGVTEFDGQRTFFVRDNGAGFDPGHAAKLFTPFHRLHTVTEFPGTGIGLSTAQRIVARFGGRMWAEAQVGLGATFFFTLAAKPLEMEYGETHPAG